MGRAFAGLAPDLDKHYERVLRSARAIGLAPSITAAEIEVIAREGIAQFPEDAKLYIRPLMFAEEGFVVPVPDSTRFILSVFDAPLAQAKGLSACLSTRRRPALDMATTDAKTSSLYPNVARAVTEAREKGFGTAVVLDPNGNVAEFATANLFIIKEGSVSTPVANGTFLAGITRAGAIDLLRGAGVEVIERTITFAEVLAADEVFATGNYAKVHPASRLAHREPRISGRTDNTQSADLYFEFAHAHGGRRQGEGG